MREVHHYPAMPNLHDRDISLRGGAAELYESTEPEVLIEGPAGTGKTTAILALVYHRVQQIPGYRVLLTRATRASMTESVLQLWETAILPGDHPALNGAHRRTRQSYPMGNGSEVVVASLENPERILGSRYDLVCLFEATEAREDQWEMLLSRLRGPLDVIRQGIAECNPRHPRHWLNIRASSRMRRIISRHTDNPAGATTEYLQTLEALTGVRRAWLLEGRWAASEHQVYAAWNEAVHVVDAARLPAAKDCWHMGGMDWGFTHPACLQIWRIDADGRMWLVAEWYASGRDVSEQTESGDSWVSIARSAVAEFGALRGIACDSAAPEKIRSFCRAGLPAVPADKDVQVGLDEVRARLRVCGDGLPRLLVARDAARIPRESERAMCGLLDEMPAYEYDRTLGTGELRQDQPRKVDDHACDAARYAAMWLRRYYLGEPQDERRTAPGSYADILGHDDIGS